MPLIRNALAAILWVLTFVNAHAQVAEQPIRIIIPYPAGGAGDATARVLAEPMRTSLKRTVIVENKPGAAGRLGVQAVKEAAAGRQRAALHADRADGNLSACLREACLRSGS